MESDSFDPFFILPTIYCSVKLFIIQAKTCSKGEQEFKLKMYFFFKREQFFN